MSPLWATPTAPKDARASGGALEKGGRPGFYCLVCNIGPVIGVSCGRRYASRGNSGATTSANLSVFDRIARKVKGRQVMAKVVRLRWVPPSFIRAVEGRLADAGFSQVSDVASADIVVTYATSARRWRICTSATRDSSRRQLRVRWWICRCHAELRPRDQRRGDGERLIMVEAPATYARWWPPIPVAARAFWGQWPPKPS